MLENLDNNLDDIVDKEKEQKDHRQNRGDPCPNCDSRKLHTIRSYGPYRDLNSNRTIDYEEYCADCGHIFIYERENVD